MACDNVFRDVTDIYTRLFNHRAALHGLTSNFVREFEEKQCDREMMALSRIFELVKDNRDRALPNITEHLDLHLKQLAISVDKTNQLCQNILKDSDEKKNDWLEAQRSQRQNDWTNFMAAQDSHSSRIDAEFESKVDSLKKNYADLETKLKEGASKVL